MRNIKVNIAVNKKLVDEKVKQSIELFKEMESRSLNEIDIDKCILDYMIAFMIYDQRILIVSKEKPLL